MRGSPPASSAMPPMDPMAGRDALIFFMVAYAFLLIGSAALASNSALLAAGAFASGAVVGSLHFLTLGWLSIAIFGALRIFTGVALGSGQEAPRASLFLLALWAGGALCLPLGLIRHAPILIVSGTTLLFAALLLFSFQIVPALARSKRGDLTRSYLIVSLASLWGTWGLGALAALARAGHLPIALPPGYFLAHLLIANFGWVGATVAGVGTHLLPMFWLSTSSVRWPVRAALPFWIALPLLALGGAFYPETLLPAGWAAAGIASVLWIAQAFLFFKSRSRKEADTGLTLAAAATLALGAGWILLLTTQQRPAFLAVIVVGWLVLFTIGIFHRIVPFLVWMGRFARKKTSQPGERATPVQVKDLLDPRLSLATAILAVLGVSAWVAGIALMVPRLATSGATALFAGVALMLGQIHPLTKRIHS